MSLPGRHSSKLLVLLYLSVCILVTAKAQTNETTTTTTTAKPEASPPVAESALVETSVNLEGQETRTKSASHGYSASGKIYLPQESIYQHYPQEEQVYEYGKRIAGPYKSSIDDAYHAQQDHIHYPQPEYIDSQGHYEQQQIDDYGHSSGKGIAYPQVKIHDDSYGKEHLDDYGHSTGKGTPYQQEKIQVDSYGKDDYGHSSGKGIAYSQVKIHSDSDGKQLDDYGHSIDKGTPYPHGKIQEDSYGKEYADNYGHSGGKGTPYQHDDSYGKEHVDEYGHSSGKGTPYQQEKIQVDSYGKDSYGHSSGKGTPYQQVHADSYAKDDYGHSSGKGTPYQQEKVQVDSYGKDSYGHSSGKGTPYQQVHADSYAKDNYGHSSGKGTPYQQVHADSYAKDDYGHSSGKGTPYQQEKIQVDSYGKDSYDHSSGKGTPYQQVHSDSYAKDDYGHSSGKGTPYQQVHSDSYGKEDYGKHEKASYSGYQTIGDAKAPYAKYSYEVPKKQYVSEDHYDSKGYGGSAGYATEEAGYHGKDHDEGSYGKGGSKGYSHGSKSSEYSSGGHGYAPVEKISHYPVVPKESGYIAEGHKEPEYLHQSPKEPEYHHEARYHSDSGKSAGIPHSDTKHGKVAVFIKQIGHSKDNHEYRSKHGERHGFLLLPVVPGKPDDKIKIETTGGYGGLDYKNIAQDYVQKPIHENDGKYSYSSYFKTGASTHGSGHGKSSHDGSKSAYGGHSKSASIPHGGHSYGGDSKLHYEEKDHYNHGGHSGAEEEGYGVAAKGHVGYEPHYENIKESSYGHAPVAQYHKEPLIYEGGKSSSEHVSGYGISGNAKYVNPQAYDHPKSYGKGGQSSYEAAIPHKGTPYTKEGPSIDAHSSYSSGHPSSKGSYEVKLSPVIYGKQHSIVSVRGKGYSPAHGYENQKSYAAEVLSPYAVSSGEKHSQIQGKGFPALSYGSFTPMISPYGSVVDFSRGAASKKSVSTKGGYKSSGPQVSHGSRQKSVSYRKPKSFAVILQRAQGGHSDGYGSSSSSPSKGGIKVGYSETGFRPIIPKHGAIGGISEYINLHSYGSSPRYSAIAHSKGSSRKH